MNRANIEKAISIMRRADRAVYMPEWQEGVVFGVEPAMTEAQLHACGNRACFAGHVAVSPEFQADGGKLSRLGVPMFNGRTGSRAIAQWLGIDSDEAEGLVDGYYGDEAEDAYYGKPLAAVTAEDVIDKLEQLLSEVGR